MKTGEVVGGSTAPPSLAENEKEVAVNDEPECGSADDSTARADSSKAPNFFERVFSLHDYDSTPWRDSTGVKLGNRFGRWLARVAKLPPPDEARAKLARQQAEQAKDGSGESDQGQYPRA
jgi:hypothetical protein